MGGRKKRGVTYFPLLTLLSLRICFRHCRLRDYHVHVVVLIIIIIISGGGGSRGDGLLEGPLGTLVRGALRVRVRVEVEGGGVWALAGGRHGGGLVGWWEMMDWEERGGWRAKVEARARAELAVGLSSLRMRIQRNNIWAT